MRLNTPENVHALHFRITCFKEAVRKKKKEEKNLEVVHTKLTHAHLAGSFNGLENVTSNCGEIGLENRVKLGVLVNLRGQLKEGLSWGIL